MCFRPDTSAWPSMERWPLDKRWEAVIIANTIKSKGISFAEDKVEYHYWKATEEGLAIAERELQEIEERIG